MSAHLHTVPTPGCYRCELNEDEVTAARAEIDAEAQEAWLAYRDAYTMRRYLKPRQVASRMRRREFIAGFLAANGIEVEA